MMSRSNRHSFISLLSALAMSSVGCGGSDPTGSGGKGRILFTTWGEAYIEEEIGPDPGDGSGFVDDWTVRYERFLVNFQNIQVADAAGKVAARFDGSRLFDNHERDVKPIISFADIEAKAWKSVGYEIAPVTAETELSDSVKRADKQLMLDGGYSLYVEGTAEKGNVEKRFAWGFAIGTRYFDCHSEQNGRDEYGITVTNNADVTVELTTHGDHLYYDRLQSAPNAAVATSLRFDALAAADRDDDGEITLAELDAAELEVLLYNPSGLPAPSQGALVTSLARTVGHFRSEGECEIEEL